MSWSEEAWNHSAGIYARILDLPFIRELQAGSLSVERFRFYIAQDARYLEHFSKALAIIGARHPQPAASLAFYRFAETAIVVENALHASYFDEYAIDDVVRIEPACHHYVHFLLSQAAIQPLEVAMASVLPCFWIYREVGMHIHKNAALAENPYRRWIETYSNEDFDRSVREAIGHCDAAAEATTPAMRQAMTEAFDQACRLELDFWDGAYHGRTWDR
jgi:thiaminase/transcriptional activator TenA